MKQTTQTKILKIAIAHFGEENQLKKAIEEASELIQAICKYDADNQKSLDHLCEEIADVEVTIEQLKMITGMPSLIKWHKEQKILRLQETIRKEQASGLAAAMPTIVEVAKIVEKRKHKKH